MNSAINQFSAPSSKDKQQKKGLPKAAKKFAQQMGLDLTGLEAEAEDMWEMLNKMSVEEPAAYENFVDEQMRQQKAEANIPESEKPKGRMFRPQAGFCIKCRTTGNDGIKIRDFGANSGKDFYINFVSHEAIEPPKDKNGKPVLDDRGASADGLEIPLLIGPTRDVDSGTMAVDVVIHPVVIARCKTYNLFKTQIIDLALEWIKQETGVQYQKKYETMPWNYHGGRGADKSTPVLFPVDEVLQRQASGGAKSGSNDSLLDTIKVEKQKSNLLDIPSSSPSVDESPIMMNKKEKDSKKTVGIQELRDDGTFAPPPQQHTESQSISKKTTKKKKTAPAVKKGFLNNNKKSLYPEGSSEGQNGGVYTRLMSRCQVVDTAKLPHSTNGQAPTLNTPKITPLPPPPPTEPSQLPEQKKSFVEESDDNSSKRPVLSLNEQNEIDQIFSGLDNEFADSLSIEEKSKQHSDDLMSQQLADFAKALSGPVGANREKDSGIDSFVDEMNKAKELASTVVHKEEKNASKEIEVKDDFSTAHSESNATSTAVCKVNKKLPKHFTLDVEVTTVPDSVKRELHVKVNNVDKSQLKETDLQVSETRVMIVIPSNDNSNADGIKNAGGSVQVNPPFRCSVNSVKASMSKKKKCIDVVITEC